MKIIAVIMMCISIFGCLSKVQEVNSNFNVPYCQDWIPIKSTLGTNLINELRNNRINHTDCYIKLEEVRTRMNALNNKL